MHPIRRQRLKVVVFIVLAAALAVGLTTYALRQNINLFYPPIAIAEGKAPTDRTIRAGGMVVEGSIKRDPDSLRVEFAVTDYQATIAMEYTGILPDLFAEGEGVVASGRWTERGVFEASEVLAKHDETYMPPEVQDAISAKPGSPQTDSPGY